MVNENDDGTNNENANDEHDEQKPDGQSNQIHLRVFAEGILFKSTCLLSVYVWNVIWNHGPVLPLMPALLLLALSVLSMHGWSALYAHLVVTLTIVGFTHPFQCILLLEALLHSRIIVAGIVFVVLVLVVTVGLLVSKKIANYMRHFFE